MYLKEKIQMQHLIYQAKVIEKQRSMGIALET
jgi:hypothetical protein